jgi:hypothetical protein
VLHLLPELLIVQMGIVYEFLRGTHCPRRTPLTYALKRAHR